MRLPKHSLRLMMGLVLAGLVLSGCFLNAGEPLPPTATGQVGLPPAQPTTPVVGVPPTATVDPFAIQEAASPTPGAVVGFATPTPDGQGGMNLTPAGEGLPLGEGGLTELDMTSTAVALQQTAFAATAVAMNQTAIAEQFLAQTVAAGGPTQAVAQINTPTPTPSLTPTQGIQLGGELTANAMILNATNEAATLTATFLPSPTPSWTWTPNPSITPTVTPTSALGPCEHVVRAGENIYRIAERYGVDWGVLRDTNGIVDVRRLSIGTVLTIPDCQPIVTGDGLQDGQGGGTTTDITSYTEHIVRPGENVYRIALRYGVTMAAIVNANGLTNINYVRAGDTLIIPR